MVEFKKSLTEAEARRYMSQILSVCNYMQNNLVVHRDLKPENLFLYSNMDIKIGDFELARKLSYSGEKIKG